MNWLTWAGRLALGTGLILTLCLAAALAALDLRLFSQVAAGVPPGLVPVIFALTLAAGSCLFLGWRLIRLHQVRLAAFRMTLGLVFVSAAILAREIVRLFGADWSISGSLLLGVNGLTLCTVGFLSAPTTRKALVTSRDLEAEDEDLRAEVETLVAEIQQAYRDQGVATARLTTIELLRDGLLHPARAFRELRLRPHLELSWIIVLLVVSWPRLTIFAGPGETAAGLLEAGLDYGLWIAFYDLGKAAMFWGLARALGQPLRYASAFGAVMVLDFPSLTTYLINHVWHGEYVAMGAAWYSRLGLAPLVDGLAGTHPAIFDALAKIDLVHAWTFVLWWIAIAVLVGAGRWLALVLTVVTFPAAHIFAWTANVGVHLVRG